MASPATQVTDASLETPLFIALRQALVGIPECLGCRGVTLKPRYNQQYDSVSIDVQGKPEDCALFIGRFTAPYYRPQEPLVRKQSMFAYHSAHSPMINFNAIGDAVALTNQHLPAAEQIVETQQGRAL
jgi:hypothetical protein